MLDAGTAWRAIYRHALGMEDREPDLPGLLRWAAETGAGGYLASPADLRAATRSRLEATLGAAAVAILDVVESGASRDALALALVFEVVFAEPGADEPSLRAAAARLERFHLHRPIEPDIGRTLARAGQDAIDDLALDDPPEPRPTCSAPTTCSATSGPPRWPTSAAGRPWPGKPGSAGSPWRWPRQAEVGDLAACEDEFRLVAGHALSAHGPYRGRLERAGMALRLARWLRTPEDFAGSFAQLARRYAEEVAFVDWARDSLAGGDDLPELGDAFGRIGQAAADRRAGVQPGLRRGPGRLDRQRLGPRGRPPRRGRRGPGGRRRSWTSRTPVLLIVMDGMSWPVARELLADLRRQHWVEAMLPGTGGPPPPVIAAIPSVTELSRMSLLAGYLHRGDQGVEKRLFPANPALLARGRAEPSPADLPQGPVHPGGPGGAGRGRRPGDRRAA